jgi:hypothetical protein
MYNQQRCWPGSSVMHAQETALVRILGPSHRAAERLPGCPARGSLSTLSELARAFGLTPDPIFLVVVIQIDFSRSLDCYNFGQRRRCCDRETTIRFLLRVVTEPLRRVEVFTLSLRLGYVSHPEIFRCMFVRTDCVQATGRDISPPVRRTIFLQYVLRGARAAAEESPQACQFAMLVLVIVLNVELMARRSIRPCTPHRIYPRGGREQRCSGLRHPRTR